MNNSETQQNPTQAAFSDTPGNGKKEITANPVPAPEPEIGVDKDGKFVSNILNAGTEGKLDLTALDNFSTVSQSREELYKLLDMMSQDSTVSAILETYAEDAVEYNDQGKIVWVEGTDPNITKYIEFLLNTMDIDKHIYGWVYSLCKYGDLYLRLFRHSDYDKDTIFDSPEEDKQRDALNEALLPKPQEELEDDENGDIKPVPPVTSPLKEDINVKIDKPNDHYVHYIEAVKNPGEMFELTRLGKTAGYIKADVKISASQTDNNLKNTYWQYSFKKADVTVYSAMDFVHACLEDNSSRTAEEVKLYLDDVGEKNNQGYTYTVKRGQSLLYNTFKIWRELSLLENAILLNRITKSSVVRTVNVEVGDMPKESVGPHLEHIKALMEQKAAINTGNSLSEYTNPGPIENNIYMPTHNGVGAVTINQTGGDVEVSKLADIDYFEDKFFGALRVPKQYFGRTDDNAGFSGGESLAIISSRYAKTVKRIQNTMIQAITDVVNLMLLDKGLTNYINKFTIHMLPPTTKDEISRRDNMSNKIRITGDIMNLLTDVEDPSIKLKVLKSLLSDAVSDPSIIDDLQKEIDKLEDENKPAEEKPVDNKNGGTKADMGSEEDKALEDELFGNEAAPKDKSKKEKSKDKEETPKEEKPAEEEPKETTEPETKETATPEKPTPETDYLPTGDELGVDLTNNNNK